MATRRGKVFYYDLERDDTLFDGEGDLQFDCYRSMRKLVKKKWEAYVCPPTCIFSSSSSRHVAPSHLAFI